MTITIFYLVTFLAFGGTGHSTSTRGPFASEAVCDKVKAEWESIPNPKGTTGSLSICVPSGSSKKVNPSRNQKGVDL